jgi:hypothetical protein
MQIRARSGQRSVLYSARYGRGIGPAADGTKLLMSEELPNHLPIHRQAAPPRLSEMHIPRCDVRMLAAIVRLLTTIEH